MKKTILFVCALIIAILLCACEKQESSISYETEYDFPTHQTTASTEKEEQPEEEKETKFYSGMLTEKYGFGKLALADFDNMYGKSDRTDKGERVSTVYQGKDSFQFNNKGLFYASISSESFAGPADIRCGMSLKETVERLFPDYAASFDPNSDEFQSLYGESYFDEFLGMTLVSPYCVFYKLDVENATQDGAYAVEYSAKSKYGTEEITLFYSTDKILTAYSMQLV